MLAIRFARVGKTKQPTYRITVSDKRRDTFGRALEILGHYNPRTKVCEVQAERIKYWISVGAQPSATVHNLLVDQNVVTGPKVKVSRKRKKKAEEAAAPAAQTVPAGGKAEKPEPAAEPPRPKPAAETAGETQPSPPAAP
jgi:small subunit ribosomal protein S16